MTNPATARSQDFAADFVPDFARARAQMIESQLRPNKVRSEAILQAMETLPRELFVPTALQGIAYSDKDIEVAPGRALLEPMVLARLLEEGGIKSTDRALDIAPATGYSTAVLATIAKSVCAVESNVPLRALAEKNLRQLGFGNAQMVPGEFAKGLPASGPYDLILINGCVDQVPDTLLDQLTETGKLLVIVRRYGPGHAAHLGEARLYMKLRGHVSHRALFDATARLLPGLAAAPVFTF